MARRLRALAFVQLVRWVKPHLGLCSNATDSWSWLSKQPSGAKRGKTEVTLDKSPTAGNSRLPTAAQWGVLLLGQIVAARLDRRYLTCRPGWRGIRFVALDVMATGRSSIEAYACPWDAEHGAGG